MKAFFQPRAGAQPVVGELPVPPVAPGEVLVRVRAAGLGGTDAGIAAGTMAAFVPHEYPLTLGRDASGVVEAVGAGVDHVAPGDHVVGHVSALPLIRLGTVAEFAALTGDAVVLKPAGLGHVDAAALPLAGSAALLAVDAVDPRPGDVVLVSGASGGVGSYAVQLLRALGARVVATGTADDAERLRGLGADEVVDFRAGSVEDQVRAAHPGGVDALLDLVRLPGGPLLSVVARGGRAASLLQALTDDALAAAGVTGTNVWAAPSRALLGRLLDRVADGSLRIDVQQVLPLDRSAEALEQLSRGTARGKLVVTLVRPGRPEA